MGSVGGQKLVKITGLVRSTTYKNIERLKQGGDLKRAPGSGHKRTALRKRSAPSFTNCYEKPTIFKCSDRRESRGQSIIGGQLLNSLVHLP